MPATETELWRPEVNPGGVGLYVHLPFCPCKCRYCDFASYVNREAWVEPYLRVLLDEIAAYRGLSLRSLYLGGGTPSMLSSEQLTRLLEAIREVTTWPQAVEVTLEANPGTGGPVLWTTARELGVTRVSVGAQAFQDELLCAMGRNHGASDTMRIVEELRDAGIGSVSLDLIYGLPAQTRAMWDQTLDEALALAPDHFSIYGLIVEDATAYGVWQRKGKLVLPGEENEIAMAALAADRLSAAGYRRYEFGSWARPGHASLHNRVYWLDDPYVGVGVGAHSCYQGRRWGNPRDLREYLKGGYPRIPVAPRTRREQAEEAVFLGLRLTEGLPLSRFHERFGEDLEDAFPGVVDRLVAQGLLDRGADRIRLTGRGVWLSNEVFVQFLE